ncbi:MAG: phosphatase domain-containing putative toxin [Planctomycetota bacterium]|jgi:protein-tyrosine phosphatase
MTRPLVPNFSWVLPDKLAGSAMPGRPGRYGRQSETEGRLAYAELYERGVRCVVSLLERGTPEEWLREAGLQYVHFPVDDFGTPDDFEAFVELLDDIHARVEAGTPTLVHCYAGIGRTGMFLAAYLARFDDFTPDEAIDHVRELRPHSVQTMGQAYVVKLAVD